MSHPDITHHQSCREKASWAATAVFPNGENVKMLQRSGEVIYIHWKGTLIRWVSFN